MGAIREASRKDSDGFLIRIELEIDGKGGGGFREESDGFLIKSSLEIKRKGGRGRQRRF